VLHGLVVVLDQVLFGFGRRTTRRAAVHFVDSLTNLLVQEVSALANLGPGSADSVAIARDRHVAHAEDMRGERYGERTDECGQRGQVGQC